MTADSGTGVAPGYVLIVDDEADFADFQKMLLEQHGLTVEVAHSGAQAMSTVTPLTPPGAIALVDMMMPGMDGLATIEALRRICPHLRFIAISGHAESRFRERLNALGVRQYLGKPFTTGRLLEAMRRELQAV